MIRRLLLGAAAGAAGTTALNAVTYADMVFRGRPASEAPAQVVEKLSNALDMDIRGEGDIRSNRLSGLGALSGIATGVGVGMAYGLLDLLGVHPRLGMGTLLCGAGAMMASDAPLAKLGITDPTSWSARDWASDIAPHLAYGLVLAATYRGASRT